MKSVCHSNNVVQPISQKNYTPSRVLERINNNRVTQPELTSLEEWIYM